MVRRANHDYGRGGRQNRREQRRHGGNREHGDVAEIGCLQDQPNNRRIQDGVKTCTINEHGLRTRRGLRTVHIGTRGGGMSAINCGSVGQRTRNERKTKKKTQKILFEKIKKNLASSTESGGGARRSIDPFTAQESIERERRARKTDEPTE